MGSNQYSNAWEQIKSCNNISLDNNLLIFLSRLLHDSFRQNKFSEPIPWIGMYIALASLFCTLAMLADLIHGFRNRKLWFPCKYLTLNAASLTAIAVALKLPMDLTNKMPVAAKFVSLAFMCTMMANLLPSLATMDSKELVTNMVALDILVITLVVNVCIQINTGVFSYTEDYYSTEIPIRSPITTASEGDESFLAIIYVVVLLMLLIIHTCSSLAILKSKQILESKYQQVHQTYMNDQQAERLTVEKLKEQVRNYSIMAGTGNPQFMTACSATTSAAGVICALTSLVYILSTLHTIGSQGDSNSDYKWSLTVIFIIQYLGIILGTIAPVFRSFADLRFKLSIKWIWNHSKVYKVESYWTQNLCDWKQTTIPFSISNRKNKIIFQFLKIIILSFCIGFQKIVVIACKIIALIPIFLVICVLSCVHCWKWIKAIFNASENIVLGINLNQLGHNDHRKYVLQLQDDKEVAERTLKHITKSVNRIIQKAEKQQPQKLIKLLDESNGFEGVGKYDSHHVPLLSAEAYLDCWSLVLVTLTTIAMSLPKIHKKVVDSLLSGVSEGLAYVFLVEESLNAMDEYVNIQKTAKLLWLEVEVSHKWLGNKLKIPTTHGNTTEQILEWFRDTAKNIFSEVDVFRIESLNENLFSRSISANSMYRITQTILLSYQDNIDEVTQEELFAHLSSMIADILASCLTNLPHVIAIKCHTSAIEKREANIQAAARLLGMTTQIINNLQERELPSLNSDELPFIDKWHAYLKQRFP